MSSPRLRLNLRLKYLSRTKKIVKAKPIAKPKARVNNPCVRRTIPEKAG